MISGGDSIDGCLVQNSTNTFSEGRYYVNVNIMVISDHHSNKKCYCPVGTKGNKSSTYNAIAVHGNHADADTICPSLKATLDITDGLDVVVGEGVWYFIITKRLTSTSCTYFHI